jgi:hypothetical protein
MKDGSVLFRSRNMQLKSRRIYVDMYVWMCVDAPMKIKALKHLPSRRKCPAQLHTCNDTYIPLNFVPVEARIRTKATHHNHIASLQTSPRKNYQVRFRESRSVVVVVVVGEEKEDSHKKHNT